MKIYLAIKFHADQQNRPLIEEIIQGFTFRGHTVVCAVRDFEKWGEETFEPRDLLDKAFSAILQSDLVVVEATEKGMGVGIEAGFAFGQGKPILTLAEKGSDLSVNLESISSNVMLYSEIGDIFRDLPR
ncbi:MAG: nucleoside 2-deoxyribosyltransferase [Bdellovibrionales bacterium]|nr:nucleoside 2-deoxyribosyltransferase [Bdellovibrionales bacterium]